jgi:hypothetical protein
MEFTETQKEILYNAWALAREGKGQVVEDSAYPFADQLARAGWLERRIEPSGDVSWWWSRAAEVACALSGLVEEQSPN